LGEKGNRFGGNFGGLFIGVIAPNHLSFFVSLRFTLLGFHDTMILVNIERLFSLYCKEE
jgi:hypothetical protein